MNKFLVIVTILSLLTVSYLAYKLEDHTTYIKQNVLMIAEYSYKTGCLAEKGELCDIKAIEFRKGVQKLYD